MFIQNNVRLSHTTCHLESSNGDVDTNKCISKNVECVVSVVSNLVTLAQNVPLRFQQIMAQQQISSLESPEALLECQMVAWAKNKSGFHNTLMQVYGDNYTFDKAESLRQQALAGNFDWLPAVRYVDADTLGGTNGAYDAESETLYLNVDLAGSDLAAPTFVEEAGRHLETVLNISGTGGNVVKIF